MIVRDIEFSPYKNTNLPFKNLGSERFLKMFLKEITWVHQGYIYLIKYTVKNKSNIF